MTFRGHVKVTIVKVTIVNIANNFLKGVIDILLADMNTYGKSISDFQNPHTNLTLVDRDGVISKSLKWKS